MLDPVHRSSSFDSHGLSPCGFSGFCLGSAGLYGQSVAAGGPGGVAGENQPVICAVASQSIFGARNSKTRRTLSTNMSRTLLGTDGKLRTRVFPPSGKLRTSDHRGRRAHHHPPMILIPVVLGLLFSGAVVRAQSCQNYGLSQGSNCLCPPGFGGNDCSAPACGGTIFQGPSRKTTPAPGNLTSAGCSCQDGWGGVGCNVCTSHSACQSGYVSQNPSNVSGVTGSDVGRNDTLVCNSAPRVWAAGQMSCSVIVESIHFYLVSAERSSFASLEPNVASDLPRCHYAKHHTNPQPHALSYAKPDFPPNIQHHRRTALVQWRGTVLLHGGLMRAVDHRFQPLHMGMSKPQVHVHNQRHVLRRGTFHELDSHHQQARWRSHHHLRRQFHVFVWSNSPQELVWVERAYTELVLVR